MQGVCQLFCHFPHERVLKTLGSWLGGAISQKVAWKYFFTWHVFTYEDHTIQKKSLNGQIIEDLAYSLAVAKCAKCLPVLQSLIDVVSQMINVLQFEFWQRMQNKAELCRIVVKKHCVHNSGQNLCTLYFTDDFVKNHKKRYKIAKPFRILLCFRIWVHKEKKEHCTFFVLQM